MYNNIVENINVRLVWFDKTNNMLGFKVEGFVDILDKKRWEKIIWKIHLANHKRASELKNEEEMILEKKREVIEKEETVKKELKILCTQYSNGYCRLLKRLAHCNNNRIKCDI